MEGASVQLTGGDHSKVLFYMVLFYMVLFYVVLFFISSPGGSGLFFRRAKSVNFQLIFVEGEFKDRADAGHSGGFQCPSGRIVLPMAAGHRDSA